MISAPEDYGLTAAQTLAHECSTAPPERFDAFWGGFREEVSSLATRIDWPREPGQHEIEFRSIRDVRIMGRVTIPSVEPVATVITTHGYTTAATFSSERHAWHDRPMMVVELRVRGYPPSVRDTGDLRPQWITRGIEDPEAWIVRSAVADVVQVCHCVRSVNPAERSITLHGESLGGGLAVIAAAQLAKLEHPVDRLVLGLPTFGDWTWRIEHYCNGAGGEINTQVDLLRGSERDALVENLLLFDAAIHARSVSAPVLCKLAERDDVVPAPTAASIFNALRSPEGGKLRFVTRYGHFDGGLADLRRHALFDRLHPDFADPHRPIEEFAASLRHVQLESPQALTANNRQRT